jgi:hypothetical protein
MSSSPNHDTISARDVQIRLCELIDDPLVSATDKEGFVTALAKYDSRDVRVACRVVEDLLEIDRVEEAEAAAREFVSSHPDRAQSHRALALALLASESGSRCDDKGDDNRRREMILTAKRAVEIEETCPASRRVLASCLSSIGRHRSAIVHAQIAAMYDGMNPRSWETLCLCYGAVPGGHWRHEMENAAELAAELKKMVRG